ncbi:unnamed protein product, partial [marine sediment metagenome]
MKLLNNQEGIVELYDRRQMFLNQINTGGIVLDVGCAEYPNYILWAHRKYGIDIQEFKDLGNYYDF